MREIKFRAWDKINNEMTLNDSFYEVQKWNRTQIELNDFELMQYTGLKDKNGVEIFEGDIVKNHNDEVTLLESLDWIFYDYYEGLFMPENFEVIGNIYENPELLEVSHEA